MRGTATSRISQTAAGIIFGGVLLAILTVPTQAAQPNKTVRAALANIKSAAGVSILERMQSCNIKFADGSSVEPLTQDNASLGAYKGDVILDVYIDIPPLPDQDPAAYTGLLARWVISHGVARPVSGWAESLQNKQVPIGSLVWMNC